MHGVLMNGDFGQVFSLDCNSLAKVYQRDKFLEFTCCCETFENRRTVMIK